MNEAGPVPADAPIRAFIFDVDGTLLTTGGAGAVAWRHAFETVHGRPVDIAEVTESGMTDHEVALTALRTVLDREPVEDDVIEVTRPYLQALPEAVADSPHYRVEPGVVELLEHLAAAGFPLGLTTGNIEPAARIKLDRGDLNRFFAFGGFGSDATDRTALTRTAVNQGIVAAATGQYPDGRRQRLVPADFVAVGDTPRDVTAAHRAGIRVVTVATGLFGLPELQESGPDWALVTLENGFPA